MLDDIFSGVLFTPDGDLLDVSSDEDVSLNVTPTSISSSEGSRAHPLRAVRGTGGQPRLHRSWRPLRTRWSISTSPARVKREKILKIQHGRESGDTGRSANAGLFEAPGCVIGRGPSEIAQKC